MRDWGHARDFVEMAWSILQQEAPYDFVIATGKQHSVREFVTLAAEALGIQLRWEGVGLQEKGIVQNHVGKTQPGDVIVKVDPRLLRPAEVETLLGDPSKAFRKLGWRPKISFEQLVNEMALKDYQLAQEECMYKQLQER